MENIPLHHADQTGDKTQYLTFAVANELLAMSINAVKEIIETPQITAVPMTPDYIRGIVNLRGNIVPVIDLGARLSRGVLILSKRSCVVLVEAHCGPDRYMLGMLVDEVKNILDIPPEDIKPPPEFGSEMRIDFIESMGRLDSGFITILSIDHVLSIQELAMFNNNNHSVAQEHTNVAS